MSGVEYVECLLEAEAGFGLGWCPPPTRVQVQGVYFERRQGFGTGPLPRIQAFYSGLTSAWLKSCQNFQVSVSSPLAKFIYTTAYSLHVPVTEVERAAALLRSIGLDKQIKKVDTMEDKIVYAGTSGEEFV